MNKLSFYQKWSKCPEITRQELMTDNRLHNVLRKYVLVEMTLGKLYLFNKKNGVKVFR